jgi:carbon storage regulator
MLVIRRRPGETLVIADDIEIQILESSSSQVKLGIRAPKSVPVIRKEIQVTRQQNLVAAQEISAGAVERLAESLKNALPGPIRPV